MMWYIVLGLVLFTVWLLNTIRRIPRVSGLHTKCVLVTGCDTGFGNAVAKSLYTKGVFVFAGCFTEEGARNLRAETGDRLRTIMLDVTKADSITGAYVYVRDNTPPDSVFWGLVNNAGIIGITGPMEFVTKSDLVEVMDVNCFGAIQMVREFLPLLKRSRGRIVNLSSMIGEVAVSHFTPYLASKFALRGFSEGLRREKAVWGIKVATICPALFRTNILNMDDNKSRLNKKWRGLDQELMNEYGAEYLDKLNAGTKALYDTAAPTISPVVDAIEHALFAKWPQGIYHPGVSAKIFTVVKDFFPTFLIDLFLKTDMDKAKPITLE